MAYQLVWTAEAEDDFKKIILYLKEMWSVESTEKFIAQTYKRLEKIVAMPSVGRAGRISNFRIAGLHVGGGDTAHGRLPPVGVSTNRRKFETRLQSDIPAISLHLQVGSKKCNILFYRRKLSYTVEYLSLQKRYCQE